MTRTRNGQGASAVSSVNELLARRAQVMDWLGRLEEVRDAESERVVDRVRADYEERLRKVVRELSAHLESLHAELSAARERRREAESRFREAEDALHEARLRHRIGELSAEAWEARRPGLEGAVGEVAAEREAAVAEVRRLEEVLSQIDSGVLVPPVPDEDPDATLAEALLAVETPRPAARPAAETATLGFEEVLPEPAALDDGLEFLEELDRALAASTEDPEEEEEAGEEEDTRPGKGTKCPECGYTNDVEAWYCGVCGIDLA